MKSLGNSEASLILEKMLDGNEKYKDYCGKLYSRLALVCKKIYILTYKKDKQLYDYLLKIIQDDTQSKISKCFLPQEIKNYLLNTCNSCIKSTPDRCESIIARKAKFGKNHQKVSYKC